VLKTYPDRCATNAPGWVDRAQNDLAAPPILREFAAAVTRYRDGSVRYIKLLDGGLVDNYGLSGFTIARLSSETPYGPLTARQAVKIRRSLFLVADGGRGISGDWTQTVDGPTGADLVSAAADTTIDSSVRSSFTAFERTMSEWRDKLVRWRCSLSAAERSKYGAPAGWDCRDLQLFVGRVNFDQLGKQRALALSSIPTRFKLSREQIEKVITAGREALRSNPTFQAFVASL